MSNTNSGSNFNNGSNSGSGWSKDWPAGTSSTPSASAASATCAEPTCGWTCEVNEITTPGCYVCNWNGSLLRVSDACFTSGGFTSFNFTCSEPLTVTFLTADPTATVETCRNLANGSLVYSNF